MNAYDKTYRYDTMRNLGAMLDYAVNTCGEDLAFFWARFLACDIADEISRGNPRYLCGLSGTELALEVSRKTGPELPLIRTRINTGSPEYWTGWIIAYLQWTLNLSFRALETCGLPITDIYAHYHPLHEAGEDRTVLFAKARILPGWEGKQLKRTRKDAGLTQEELSARSGIPLRNIRAYEQGRIPLDKVASGSLRALYLAIGLA